MNKLKIVLGILLFFVAISACEKDDICVDGNTPLLIIDFYDFNDPSSLKEVPTLVVNGFIPPDSTLAAIPNTSASSISIPLRIDENNASFIISEKLTADSTINIDTLTFSYDVKEKFASRACGLVATYENLMGNIQVDSLNWIKDIEIVTPIIENSTTAHVKIFH